MITPFEITRSAQPLRSGRSWLSAFTSGPGGVARGGAQRREREVDADDPALARRAHHRGDAAGAAADVDAGRAPGQGLDGAPEDAVLELLLHDRAGRSGRGSGRSAP